MFFDLEDYATRYRSTIDPNCVNPNIPKVDNSSIECSQIISTNCVVTSKGYPYLGIGSGETVTSVLEKIKEKFKSLSFTILNLGSGIGLLKSFSGGVLSAKSIKAGNNIVLTEANDTITINATGGGSGGGIIDITHANLVIAKNASTLSPGTYYRITDFRTMYDQPDFDSNGDAKTSVAAKQGPIEPITVLALKNNVLSREVYQEDFPEDTIEYILEFTTPVNQTVTKGRIVYLKDKYGTETDYDHRNVEFKRYAQPYLNFFPSYKDTSLNSTERKTIYLPFFGRNFKSLGYFETFLMGQSDTPFDLPNNVVGSAHNSSLGHLSTNSTFNSLYNTEITQSRNVFIEMPIYSSRIFVTTDSTLYNYNNGTGSILNCNIREIRNSYIGIESLTSSTIHSIEGANLGRLNISNSRVYQMYYPGTINQNGLPADRVTISSSDIGTMTDVKGISSFVNSYINVISTITFLSNIIENVKGNRIENSVFKNAQTIKHLNILGDINNVNFSTSTIVYNTALSKEIIQHPTGLHIKHYDQFGAAVINNVNA
jgi:hypothetical protein